MPTSNKFYQNLYNISPLLPWETTTLSISKMPFSAIVIGFGSVFIIMTIYHCIANGWCDESRNNQSQTSQQTQHHHHHHHYLYHQQQRVYEHEMLEIESFENSMAVLISAHKYKKGTGMVNDDEMCMVCLSQFEEGEELRTLPECLHSYHAPCIDMWLYSHLNCPMCRTVTNISPSVGFRLYAFGYRKYVA